MKRMSLLLLSAAALLVLTPVRAAMPAAHMCGQQLMSPVEQQAHRDQMRAATGSAEREKLQHDHHEAMLARAKERGVTLPQRGCPGHGAMGHQHRMRDAAPTTKP
jgi:hypothetical protein